MAGAQRNLTGLQGTAQTAAGGAAAAFQRAGPAIGQALTGVGTAAGYAFAGATESAAQLADEMANVRTVVPDADIAGLTDEVQALSRASGVGTSDLTAGLYDLVSAGVSADEAIGVLAASTNLAIGGLGTTAGAADVVTSALNAYGEGADQAGRVTDIFALAIQKGKVTADEIGSSIANIAPVAAAAGISLEEVGAGYAALTAKGVPAAQAATQMRAAISALLTPNEQLNRIQEQTGINFAELAKTKGLGVAMEQLRQSFADNGDALAQLAGVSEEEFPAALKAMQAQLGLANSDVEKLTAIAGKDGASFALQELAKTAGQADSGFAKSLGSIEAYQFALNATGDNADDFQATVKDMYGATGTAAEQAAIKMESPVEQGKRLFATFSTFLQDVGAPFASSLGPILFGLNQLSPALRGLISPAKIAGGALGGLATKVLPKMISGFAGIGSKLLPALSGGLGSAFTAVVPMLGGAISGVVTGIGGLFAAALPLLAAALPFLIAGAIIAGIVLLIVNPEIRDAVFGFIGGVIGWIGDALSGIGDFLGGIFGGAFEVVASVIGTYLEIITFPIRTFIGFLGTIFGGIAGAASTAWNAVSTIVGTAISIITAPIRLFIDLVTGIFSAAPAAASGAWNLITGIVGNAIAVITAPIRLFIGLVTGIFSAAPAAAQGAWSIITGVVRGAVGVITGVIRGIIAVAQAVWSTVKGIFGAIGGAAKAVTGVVGGVVSGAGNVVGALNPFGGKFLQFQEGAWKIPQTMPALVHEGEMILPPDLAESFRAFLGGGGGGGAPAADGGESLGQTIYQEIVVPITGLLRAEKPSDVADALRRVADLGYLSPKPARSGS